MNRLQNFSGTMEFIAAINSTAVTRLRKTWQVAGYEYFESAARLRYLLANNYACYRRFLQRKELTPPVVPFVGIFLSDLTFLEDGNPTFMRPDDRLNFFKFSKVSDSIDAVLRFQDFPYQLDSDGRLNNQLLATLYSCFIYL